MYNIYLFDFSVISDNINATYKSNEVRAKTVTLVLLYILIHHY